LIKYKQVVSLWILFFNLLYFIIYGMDWLVKLNECLDKDYECALITIIDKSGSIPQNIGAKMVVDRDGNIAGTIGGGAVEKECIEYAKKSIINGLDPFIVEFKLDGNEWISIDGSIRNMICGGNIKVFIEPINNKKMGTIIMFGGGHIAKKMADFCDILDIPYIIYDNREEFANRERFSNAKDIICADYNDLLDRVRLNDKSFCVIMTHGHKYDKICLERLLRVEDIPYIGMIGSKSKVKLTFENIKKKGINIDKRVYSPIGLYINGKSPQLIALSIISEIMIIMGNGKLMHRRLEV